MKILAFSTRDYYDIVSSNDWKKIECPLLEDFISDLYEDSNTESKEEKLLDFFIQEKKGVKFWEDNTEPFSMLRRYADNSEFAIYVIPCIPTYHLKDNGMCEAMKIRHDYIGRFLSSILQDSKELVKAHDLFLAVHDLDIFKDNDEKNLDIHEVEPGSFLANIINEGKILPENIFGFQHEGDFYSLFNQKLGREALPSDLYSNISNKIKETAGKKREKVVVKTEKAKDRDVVTAKPVTPISFSFSINSEKKISYSIPMEFKEDCNAEYFLLANAMFKELKEKIIECEPGDYSSYLLIHHINDIQNYAKQHKQYVFGQNYFIESDAIYPIIHFCDASLDELSEIYRYASVIDCSIWNHYVQIKLDNESSTISFVDEVQLENAISDIANYSNRHLYNLVVAKESADLVARMTYASFIKRFPETEGHGDYVSPFVFHSEQTVRNSLIYEEFRETNKVEQIKKQYRWRILLIDDKAVADMGTDITKKIVIDGLPFNCKVTIIKNVLNGCFDKIHIREWNDSSPIADGTECLLEFAQSKDDAILALQDRKYDIILLDYLLDRLPNGKHNYGYQILETIYGICDPKAKNKIKDNPIKNIQIGPNNRLFFMFTSAYSSAVNERLLAEGLNLSEDYWHISLGACPTNTPQLFLYNIIKLMDKRIEDSHIDNLSVGGMMKVVGEIYGSGGSVRKKASEYYHKIQSYQYYYRNLLEDYDISVGNKMLFETKESVLVTNFLNQRINIGGLLEHLAQLVHLTGFGTIRQWPEMWEEYLYVKAQLEPLIANEQEKEEVFIKICHCVEDYIRELKSEAI